MYIKSKFLNDLMKLSNSFTFPTDIHNITDSYHNFYKAILQKFEVVHGSEVLKEFVVQDYYLL